MCRVFSYQPCLNIRMELTINGDTLHINEWAEKAGISTYTIKQRLTDGYSGEALLISNRDWRRLESLDDALPADEYEKAIRKMIKSEIPQFRFNIIIELCREIGHGVFKASQLRRNLSRGSMGRAIACDAHNVPLPGSLWDFTGPQGTHRMSWMIRRADQVRRWQSPVE